MSWSYSDIAMSKFDTAALPYHFQPTLWKGFRDDILTVWTHRSDTLERFLDNLNQIDSTGKIKFTMQGFCFFFLFFILRRYTMFI